MLWLLLAFAFTQCTNATTSRRNASNIAANQNKDQYVSYVSDPDGRGTLSLVLSCLLTLILCVWSAVHPNVPAQERRGSLKATILFTTKWVLAGIYAPELVVFVAWRQWCSARMLQKHIDQLPDASSKTDSNSGSAEAGSHRPKWTMVHSFFACAGGFSVELDSLRDAIPPLQSAAHGGTVDEKAKPTRLTLTARGVLFLAENGWLPTVYREEIDDKSKANDLAKATVIIQATWMLVQVIGRLAARLPVTLLEINTVAHVLCAFGMELSADLMFFTAREL
ncbi:hypothetical protein LMH87_004238 [Akanthomyces muscarius]|uniref:Uncharacterized protein n=1 Tax=Akanthomyces muscarius TaxID=2231603 RepID=A0A9W8Q2X2_AKAMU|nr:hypothetical protein LMH87_004238 [Akanthomyces muscarius]KAJ4145386.1 hypothetical protein LMH87_004238 [Akanthomyces muscarius]